MRFYDVYKSGAVRISPEFFNAYVMRHAVSNSIDTLANVLGNTETELFEEFDLEDFRRDFHTLVANTASRKAKDCLSKRLAAAGKVGPPRLFRDADPKVWEAGLRATFSSENPSTVFDFLGGKAGALDIATVRDMNHNRALKPSVTMEIEYGMLPVEILYDQLRIVARWPAIRNRKTQRT